MIAQLLSSPDGVEAALKRSGQTLPIKPSKTLQAHERVQIYAEMYFVRLRDSLAEDFPKLAQLIGQESFTQLAKEYLRDHPPSSFTLRYVSRSFASFLNSHPLSLRWPFLSELARLEYAFIESFDAADSELLRSEVLQQTLPELWGNLSFQLVPAAQLKSFHWQVDQLWEQEKFYPEELTRMLARTELLIWRKDFEVTYRRIDKFEAELLPLMVQGVLFAELCEKASMQLPEDEAATTLSRYVQKWLGEKLLVLLEG